MNNNTAFELKQSQDLIIRDYLRKGKGEKKERCSTDFTLFKLLNKYIAENRMLTRKVYIMAICLERVQTLALADVKYISRNLFVIADSLDKQKGLAQKVMQQTGYVPTEKKQQWAIRQMVAGMTKRLEHISKTIVPENLRMTPVADYLRITGKDDWDADIQAFFGFCFSDGDVQKKEAEYIKLVFETVQGEDVTYLAALKAYNERQEALARKRKEEEKATKEKEAMEKAEKRETALAISSFKFSEDLRRCLSEGCYFETVRASKKDLEDNKALADGYIVLQSKYSKMNASCTHYYRKGTGEKRHSVAYKLASATVMTRDEAKALCDEYYVKGKCLNVVFGIRECRVIYDPSRAKV